VVSVTCKNKQKRKWKTQDKTINITIIKRIIDIDKRSYITAIIVCLYQNVFLRPLGLKFGHTSYNHTCQWLMSCFIAVKKKSARNTLTLTCLLHLISNTEVSRLENLAKLPIYIYILPTIEFWQSVRSPFEVGRSAVLKEVSGYKNNYGA
jgi:hypothetical protein